MPLAAFLTDAALVTHAPTSIQTVAKDGTVIAVLENANVLDWEKDLYGSKSARFEMSTNDPQAIPSVVAPKATEVQIVRNGVVLWWGFVYDFEVNQETVVFQAVGLFHYFAERFFGKANRTNLVNPASWTAVGVTATFDPDLSVLDLGSTLLDQATPGVDTYLQQVVTINSGGNGSLLTLVSYYWLSIFGVLAAALDGRGLYLELSDGTSRAVNFERIDEDSSRGQWVRAETTIQMPPNVTWDVVCRCYAPTEFVWWDLHATTLTKMESFSHLGEDQAAIVAATVDYAQDRGPFTHGKSNLLIDATSATCPPTGVIRDYTEQFANHTEIGESLLGWTTILDGVDVWVELDRTFHTGFPSKGTDRTATVTITNDTIAEGPIAYRFDGSQAVSSVVVTGDGDGPDREEGGAVDASLFGGTTFETVISAPAGTPIDRLGNMAAMTLATRSDPSSLTFTVAEYDALLVELVDTGDRITLDLDFGYFQASGAWRVIAVSMVPNSEALTFECNPVAGGGGL